MNSFSLLHMWQVALELTIQLSVLVALAVSSWGITNTGFSLRELLLSLRFTTALFTFGLTFLPSFCLEPGFFSA